MAARFIDSPAIAVLLIAVALAVASVLVRVVPAIRRTQTHDESGRQPAIDGLRGFLGISVFVHHTVITWFLLHGDPWQLPPSRFIVHAGQTSVALFFMITAFLFWGRVLDRRGDMNWTGFAISRLYRLYPAYLMLVGLLLTAALAVTLSSQPAVSGPVAGPLMDWLMFTMFGAPDLNGLPATYLLVAGVTWSLRYEWLFYLALPLIAFLTGCSRRPGPALLSAAAVGAIFWRLHWHNTFDPHILLAFAGGMAAAHFQRMAGLAAFGRTSTAGLAGIVALALAIGLLPTAYMWQATAGLTLFFTVVASGNSLWGLLLMPGLLWLGEITYSIYLLHGFFLWLVLRCILPHALAANGFVFIASVTAIGAGLVLAASVVFLTIERPAVLLGQRRSRRSGLRRADAVPAGSVPRPRS